MIVLSKEAESELTFKHARLYKNIKSLQLVLATPIKRNQIESIKKSGYIRGVDISTSIIEGDMVILENGRISILYKQTFNAKYIKIGKKSYVSKVVVK